MKKTIIVTGATSGIGYAVCEAMLNEGYPVIGVGRSEDNCCEAKKALLCKYPEATVSFIAADLMHQREVIRAAREIEGFLGLAGSGINYGERKNIGTQDIDDASCDGVRSIDISGVPHCGGIHALINNAGCVRSRFMTTEDGYEQQFALNNLSGFLLTQELTPLLCRDNAAVIFTSSASHKMMRMNWSDLMFEKKYKPLRAYKQSKLCNLLVAYRLRELGIRAVGVDPGLVRTNIGNKNTSGIVDTVWNLRKRSGISPSESAKIFSELCENGFSGIYYGLGRGSKDKREIREKCTSSRVNRDNARRLYDICSELCGMKAPKPKGEVEHECIDNRRKRRPWQSNGYGLRKAWV